MATTDGKYAIRANGSIVEFARIDVPTMSMEIEITSAGIVKVSPQTVIIPIARPGTDVATGDAQGGFAIPIEMDGFIITAVRAYHTEAGAGSGNTDIAIRRARAESYVEVLSTKLRIDSGEIDYGDSGQTAVINTMYDDVLEGDFIVIDIDDVPGTTAPKGLSIEIVFDRPA